MNARRCGEVKVVLTGKDVVDSLESHRASTATACACSLRRSASASLSSQGGSLTLYVHVRVRMIHDIGVRHRHLLDHGWWLRSKEQGSWG